ncbi:hypothetical protein ACWD6U_24125, partial [Streptomyces sp. NPDC005149]
MVRCWPSSPWPPAARPRPRGDGSTHGSHGKTHAQSSPPARTAPNARISGEVWLDGEELIGATADRVR